MVDHTQRWPYGVNEAHMLAHDWPEMTPRTLDRLARPRYFLYCETCGAMFLTPFRVRVCRECWNIGRRPQ